MSSAPSSVDFLNSNPPNSPMSPFKLECDEEFDVDLSHIPEITEDEMKAHMQKLKRLAVHNIVTMNITMQNEIAYLIDRETNSTKLAQLYELEKCTIYQKKCLNYYEFIGKSD